MTKLTFPIKNETLTEDDIRQLPVTHENDLSLLTLHTMYIKYIFRQEQTPITYRFFVDRIQFIQNVINEKLKVDK